MNLLRFRRLIFDGLFDWIHMYDQLDARELDEIDEAIESSIRYFQENLVFISNVVNERSYNNFYDYDVVGDNWEAKDWDPEWETQMYRILQVIFALRDFSRLPIDFVFGNEAVDIVDLYRRNMEAKQTFYSIKQAANSRYSYDNIIEEDLLIEMLNQCNISNAQNEKVWFCPQIVNCKLRHEPTQDHLRAHNFPERNERYTLRHANSFKFLNYIQPIPNLENLILDYNNEIQLMKIATDKRLKFNEYFNLFLRFSAEYHTKHNRIFFKLTQIYPEEAEQLKFQVAKESTPPQFIKIKNEFDIESQNAEAGRFDLNFNIKREWESTAWSEEMLRETIQIFKANNRNAVDTLRIQKENNINIYQSVTLQDLRFQMLNIHRKFCEADLIDMNFDFKTLLNNEVEKLASECFPVVLSIRHLQYQLTRAIIPKELCNITKYGSISQNRHNCNPLLMVDGEEKIVNLSSFIRSSSNLYAWLEETYNSHHLTKGEKMHAIWSETFVNELENHTYPANYHIDFIKLLVIIEGYIHNNSIINNDVIQNLANLQKYYENYNCRSEFSCNGTFKNRNIISLKARIDFYKDTLDADLTIYFNDISCSSIDLLFPEENRQIKSSCASRLYESEKRILNFVATVNTTEHSIQQSQDFRFIPNKFYFFNYTTNEENVPILINLFDLVNNELISNFAFKLKIPTDAVVARIERNMNIIVNNTERLTNLVNVINYHLPYYLVNFADINSLLSLLLMHINFNEVLEITEEELKILINEILRNVKLVLPKKKKIAITSLGNL